MKKNLCEILYVVLFFISKIAFFKLFKQGLEKTLTLLIPATEAYSREAALLFL